MQKQLEITISDRGPRPPERRKRYTSSRVEDEDAQTCPCGKARESRIHIVAECELYKDERDILDEEMREVKEGGIKSFDALDNREKTIASLGDRCWQQTAKQDGDKICKRFLCNVWKKRNERLNVLYYESERSSVSQGTRGQWSYD